MELNQFFSAIEGRKLEKAVADIQYRKRLAEQKLSAELAEMFAQLSAQYATVGCAVYEMNLQHNQSPIDVDGNFVTISELREAISIKQEKLQNVLARYDEELSLIAPAHYSINEGARGVTCISCGSLVDPSNKFCQQCGAESNSGETPPTSGIICQSCGAGVHQGNRFCQSCGTSVQ